MADIPIEDLFNSYGGTGSFNPNAAEESVKEQRGLDFKHSQATYADKQEAFFQQAASVNTFKKFLDYGQENRYSNIEADDEFFIDDSTTINQLNRSKLSMDDFSYLRKSKSQKEFDMRLLHLEGNERINQNIRDTLDNSERVTATIAGSVVDVDIAVGFGAGALYKTGTSIMKIAAIEGGFEAGLAASKYAIDDNYSMEDVVMDTVLGTGIAVGATSLFKAWDNTRGAKTYLNNDNASIYSQDYSQTYKWSDTAPETEAQLAKRLEDEKLEPVREKIRQQIEEGRRRRLEVESNKEAEAFEKAKNTEGTPEFKAEQQRLDDVRRRIYKDMGKNEAEIEELIKRDRGDTQGFMDWFKTTQREQQKINDDIKTKIDSFDKETATAKEIQTHADEVAELRGKAAEYREKLRGEEANRREQLDAINNDAVNRRKIEIEERAYRKQRNQELADKFKDKKYESYRLNRRAFFNRQKNIQSKILDDELKAINDEIDGIKAQLKEAHNKVKETTNKSWLTRRKAKVTQLQKDLETAKGKLSSSLDNKPLSKKEQDLNDMADEMAEDIHLIKDDLLKLVKEASEEDLPALLDLVERMKKSKPDEMEQILNIVKSRKGNKGVMEYANKHKGKVLPRAALIAAGLAVAGNASEGDISQELTGAFLLVVVAGVFGKDIWRNIKNPNLRARLKSMQKHIKKSKESADVRMSPEAGTVRRAANFIGESAYTRLTSTMAPFKKAGGEAYDIATKLLAGKDNGSGAEVTKAMWNHSAMSRYNVSEKKAFKEWKVEQGKLGNRSTFQALNDETAFRRAVADAMVNVDKTGKRLPVDSPAIASAIKTNDELLAEAYNRAKEYGVYGFENITYTAGKLPRYWEHDRMYNILQKVGAEDRDKIIASLADAFAKSNGDPAKSLEKATDFVNRWEKGFEGTINVNRESVFDMIEQHLKDDVTFDDVANSLNTSMDKTSRAKYRIEFDERDISAVTLDIEGEDVIMDVGTMINRDIKSIMDKTINQLNASSALAQNGYKSMAELELAINSKGIPKHLRKELKLIRDLVAGIPIPHNDTTVHNIASATKDMVIASKLAFVVFSLGTELLNTLGSSNLHKTLKALGQSVAVGFGKDSYMMGELSRISGLGTNVDRLDFTGFRGVAENMENIDDITNVSKIRNATMKIRDYSLYLNRLMSATDLFQRAGTAINTEKLARFIQLGDTNTLSGVSKTRLGQYGIDDKKIAILKDKFEFNANGKLKDIDFSTWTAKEEDALGEMLRGMNQSISPETTLGETALYTHTTDIGRVLGTLTTYPMQIFNIQGITGVQSLDKTAMIHMFGAFAGSYIGLQARYAVQGKEVDNEKILMYSLMNIPQLGALSYMSSMMNPATLQVVNDAASLIGADKR